ncbi:MAG: cell division protein FtsA [Rhodospirillaceae bacterium]
MAKSRQKSGVIAALDVGTTKVACFIAVPEADGTLRVVGVGHHRSRGMRNGQVASMADLEASVRSAVEAAEQMAGQRVDTVLLSITGGGLSSQNVETQVPVHGHPVRDTDVRRILDQGRAIAAQHERDILHCLPTTYSIDGGDGILDPRGMFGETLGVRIHMVSASTGPLRNLATVIDRCHLDVAARVASPYSSALACTVNDEKEMGVTVLDMGGGTTSVSVFVDGYPMFADVIPVGGNHVTNDLAKGLSTSATHAERLKTVWGTVLPSPSDTRELLKVPLVGEEEDTEGHEVPRSEIVRMIRPRIEETFELVRNRLGQAGMLHAAGRRVVLTGGGSQLQGLREMAELILDKQVRLGRPRRLKGLPESASGPAFATCAGLLRYAIQDHVAHAAPGSQQALVPDETGDDEDTTHKPAGRMGRMVSWLKENF